MPETKKEPKINLLEQLGEPLSEDAVQRTKKEKTHKSYDTDGYGYQYCVDRLNDILGEKWGFSWEILKEIEGKYSTGKPFYDITVKVSIWINDKENIRSAVGGHIAVLYADALKGAITNAFKKTAAFWGVGRQAYLGLLDDDNKPLPEEEGNGNGNKGRKETGSTITPPPSTGKEKPLPKPNAKVDQLKHEIRAMTAYMAHMLQCGPEKAREILFNAEKFPEKDKETGKETGNTVYPNKSLEKIESEKWLGIIHSRVKAELQNSGQLLEDAVQWHIQHHEFWKGGE